MGGGKSIHWYPLVSTVCACAKNPTISWGIVYHHLRNVDLCRTAPKHVRLELILQAWQVKARALISTQVRSLLYWKGRFHVESRAAGCNQTLCIRDGKDVFLWLPTRFGSTCYETLPFVFNYKHRDGGTGGGCSVVLVMSLVSHHHRIKHTASHISSLVISPHNNHV